jgi:Tfp pilus assembly protein PilF
LPLNIDSQNHQLRLAVEHQRAGRFSEAVNVLNGILREIPNDFDCLYLLAVLYAQQGQLDLATKTFNRAALIRPNFAEVHYNLGLALCLSGNTKEGLRHYQRVLEISRSLKS